MKIELGSWNNPIWSSTSIIIGALLDWATLVVDPTGRTVPEHVARGIKIVHQDKDNPALIQNQEQKKHWEQLIGRFYYRLIDLSKQPEDTFSDSLIASIDQYLLSLPDHAEMTKEKRYPENAILHLKKPDRESEDTRARWLTEYMLSFDEEEALCFLESVAVKWTLELPQGQLGRLHNDLV
jgi:hypothetical protein